MGREGRYVKGGIIELFRVRPGESKHHPAAAFRRHGSDLSEQLRQSGRHCLVLCASHGEHDITGCDWSAIVPACAGVEIECESNGIPSSPGLRQGGHEVALS